MALCVRWTDAEDEIVIKLYPTATEAVLAVQLPGRSFHSIRNRAGILRVKRNAKIEYRKCGNRSHNRDRVIVPGAKARLRAFLNEFFKPNLYPTISGTVVVVRELRNLDR
jgi:hypothetical protein